MRLFLVAFAPRRASTSCSYSSFRIRLSASPLPSDHKCIEIVRAETEVPRPSAHAALSPTTGYDQLAEKCFEFFPLRRPLVSCTPCGAWPPLRAVVSEDTHLGDGKL